MLSLKKLSKVKTNILLLGESGTGKTYQAEKIHALSSRKDKPFVKINLATTSEHLMESELFGHKKGAFTGAHVDRKGFCDNVGNGTLFLDEIGDIGMNLQKKLLMLLEEREYYSIGSNQKKNFTGTIILATNKNLNVLVEEGKFREDLYYRLGLFQYKIYSLKELSDEKKKNFIVEFFLKARQNYGKNELYLSVEAIEKLIHKQWKGNLRELKNMMEYLVVCNDKTIKVSDIPANIYTHNYIPRTNGNYHETIDNLDRQIIYNALIKNKGVINKTSDNIGLNKVTLISKIKKYDINIADIKRTKK